MPGDGHTTKQPSVGSPDPLAALHSVISDELIGAEAHAEPAPIVIVHAPRAGSTLLYQLLVTGFAVDYLPNVVNELTPSAPLVGLASRIALGVDAPVDFESHFGKTAGPWGPSEASSVHAAWFGGGHPSETVSASFRSRQAADAMRDTLAGARRLSGVEMVLKNAWNSFRIRAICDVLPRARFVWIRRDVVEAAASDLLARQVTKGDLHAWNSATPASVERLRSLPPWRQVAENQLAYAEAIARGLEPVSDDRWADVWYEDLVADPWELASRLADRLDVPTFADRVRRDDTIVLASRAERSPLPEWLIEARSSIARHVSSESERYRLVRHAASAPAQR